MGGGEAELLWTEVILLILKKKKISDTFVSKALSLLPREAGFDPVTQSIVSGGAASQEERFPPSAHGWWLGSDGGGGS